MNVRSARILCRLRLSPNNKRASRESLRDVLQRAVLAVRRRREKHPAQLVTAFIEKATEVIQLVEGWIKYQVPAELCRLVTGVYHLSQLQGLALLIHRIPNTDMEPSARSNVLNIVKKVARYREAALFLSHAARKFPLVSHMRVVPVNPPQAAFNPHRENAQGSLSNVFGHVCKAKTMTVERLCRILELTQEEVESRYRQGTNKAVQDANIHAEIQLLYQCDSAKYHPPPRVVCSSKDACFLCNAFINMHGKMYTPRSHGKLYAGWRLPSLSRSSDRERMFTSLLENLARESVKKLFSTNKRTLNPDPNESTVTTLVISSSAASTLNSESSTQSSTSSLQAEETEPDPVDTVDVITPHTKAISSFCQSPGGPTLVPRPGTDVHLTPDHAYVDDLTLGNVPFVVRADSLEIQVERCKAPHCDCFDKLECGSFSLELLTSQDSLKVRTSSIDVDSLQDEITHEWDGAGCIYLTARGSIVKLQLDKRDA